MARSETWPPLKGARNSQRLTRRTIGGLRAIPSVCLFGRKGARWCTRPFRGNMSSRRGEHARATCVTHEGRKPAQISLRNEYHTPVCSEIKAPSIFGVTQTAAAPSVRLLAWRRIAVNCRHWHILANMHNACDSAPEHASRFLNKSHIVETRPYEICTYVAAHLVKVLLFGQRGFF